MADVTVTISRKDDALAGRLSPTHEADATNAFRAEFNRQLLVGTGAYAASFYDRLRIGVGNTNASTIR